MSTSAKVARKEVRDVAAQWVEHGYSVEPNKGGHLTVRDKTGNFVTTLPSSPSDRRWRLNALAKLRRTLAEQGSQVKERSKEQIMPASTWTPTEWQTAVSKDVFNELKSRGWPTTGDARSNFVTEAMRTAREMFGVEDSPWGSEGSVQAALTDLLSGKRAVSERGLQVFAAMLTEPTVAPDEPPARAQTQFTKNGVQREWVDDEGHRVVRMENGRKIIYASAEEIETAVQLVRNMVDEIDEHNKAGVRKGHTLRFGTMKYAGVWCDRTHQRMDVVPATWSKTTGDPVNSWTTRLRDLYQSNGDEKVMMAVTVQDAIRAGSWWAAATAQEKWQYLNDPRFHTRRGPMHGIVAPEGVTQVDELPELPEENKVAKVQEAAREIIGDLNEVDALADAMVEDLQDALDQYRDTKPRVDTPASTPGYPLHMRVLFVMARSLDGERNEVLDLANEIRQMEERGR